jgi:hypothetical protein
VCDIDKVKNRVYSIFVKFLIYLIMSYTCFFKKKFIKTAIFIAVVMGGVLAILFPLITQSSVSVSANPCDIHPSGCIEGISRSRGDVEGLITIILNIASILTMIVMAVTVVYIILGAWFIIVGVGGDGPTYEKGLKVIKNAVLGLVIAVLAFSIVTLINGFLDGDGILADILNSSK